MKFSCRNFLLEDFLSDVNFQSVFQSSTEEFCSKCNCICPSQLLMPHFLTVSQPFKWHVFESRDILLNIFTSIIQFNKIYLTIANLKIIQFSQSLCMQKAKNGFIKRTQRKKWLYKKNPLHSAPPQTHTHTKALLPADPRAVEQRTQIHTRR